MTNGRLLLFLICFIKWIHIYLHLQFFKLMRKCFIKVNTKININWNDTKASINNRSVNLNYKLYHIFMISFVFLKCRFHENL